MSYFEEEDDNGSDLESIAATNFVKSPIHACYDTDYNINKLYN